MFSSAGDIQPGWTIGAGFLTSQARLAMEFHFSVRNDPKKAGKAVIPTGRSLGGGLAGLVAGRTGEEAVRLKAESTVWDNLVLSPDGSSGNRDAAGIVRVRVGKVI